MGKSFSLGFHTMVFQDEIFANQACVMENEERGYTSRNIYTVSNSQAAIKALDSFQIDSKLVWDCDQSLVKLVEHNRIQLVWVPGHMGTDGNETADELAKESSSHPLKDPEPVLGISADNGRRVIMD
jgi:Ribonuclease HI